MKRLFLCLAAFAALTANAQFTSVENDVKSIQEYWEIASGDRELELNKALIYDVDGDGNNELFMGSDGNIAFVAEDENGDKAVISGELSEGENYVFLYDDAIVCLVNVSPDRLLKNTIYYKISESSAFLIGLRVDTYANVENEPEPVGMTSTCKMIVDGELQEVGEEDFDYTFNPQIAHVSVENLDGWVGLED